MYRILLVLSLCCCSLDGSVFGSEAFEMAPGLKIRLIADDDVVPDCTCLSVDQAGRLIASGPGYLKMLQDKDGDQVIDDVITLTRAPSRGAHGICVDGTSIYYVGDQGVWRIEDSDGDTVADTEPEKVLSIKTGGEHDAHALRIGPDGYWYLIAGNGAESMFSLQNLDEPRFPNPRAGVIWRISPDWSEREVWAHGFRNAYDFDFAPDHSIDTFDSDGERDVSLPWYRPTRVYRVRAGDDAGWMSRSWKRPDLDPQMPRVLAEFGRGSPTGVLRARRGRLPKRFHEGVFVLDWTFGRVLFVGDHGDAEVVAKATGNSGFAVTDIDETPDGRIIVSVGGRRSRGGLYSIDSVKPRSSPITSQSLWIGPDDRNQAKDHAVRANQVSADSPDKVSPALTVTEIDLDSFLVSSIIQLRNEQPRQVDSDAAEVAVDVLSDPASNREQLIAAATLLIESVGGLGPGDPKDARGQTQVAPVFDSCRSILRPRLAPELIEEASESLMQRIKKNNSDTELNNELIRALAVIEPDSKAAFDCVLNDLHLMPSPVDKLHRLIALARLPAKRSDQMTEQIVEVMLQIPRMVESSKLKIDRNWAPRLGELFVALEYRDSLLPSRLVANAGFGQPADLVWTDRMDPENLERARQKLLRAADHRLSDPRVARFIARGDDAVPIVVIRGWLGDPMTRPAAWLTIASHAKPSDIDILREAALSVDSEARTAASAALKRLGEAIPVRDSNSQTIQNWMLRADKISQIEADPVSGKTWFQQRQCEQCHNGVKALGPSLEGIRKRFNTEDLLRSLVDPSHTIPDRYRAKQVLTIDGNIIVGMPIYESVDGVTLMTAESEMKRINAKEIERIQDSSISLMPEGLLEGMSDIQVAQLLAYLQAL